MFVLIQEKKTERGLFIFTFGWIVFFFQINCVCVLLLVIVDYSQIDGCVWWCTMVVVGGGDGDGGHTIKT